MNPKSLSCICFLALPLTASATLSLTHLRVSSLTAPLGIDNPAPTFSWELASSQRGCLQTSYAITVAEDDGDVVWDSGTIRSAEQTSIAYAGNALKSCTAYTWTVTVTDNLGQTAQESSTFETAFLNPEEWTAQWIGAGQEASRARYEVALDAPLACRYLRLNVTKLGARAAADPGFSFVQLDEVEIYEGTTNVAPAARFTASNSWSLPQYGWDVANVNDGRIGDAAALGWTTTQNPALPVTLTADLGTTRTVSRIVLYPRQGTHAVGDDTHVANFPASFSLQASTNGSSYANVYSATDAEAPTCPGADTRIPYYYKAFTLPAGKTVRRARLYATALGVCTMELNGRPVTDAVLEPGESEYEKTILYSTYDVTDLLQAQGENTLLARVAGGLYNVTPLAGRYSKGEVTNNGTPALLAELRVAYTDGSTQRIVTDASWLTAPSPTLGSNWWGGEDYDHTLPAWTPSLTPASPAASLSAPVAIVTPHFTSPHAGVSGHGILRSRMYPPLRVVERWPAVGVKTIRSGGHTLRMVDFGRNFAGQYRFRLRGKPGQTISLRCGESLNPDGSVFMQNYYTGPADTYDQYTFAGDAEGETWGPEFMYHGFRYLQIIGLDEEPRPEDFTALRIRADVEQVGQLETSNPLINDIHVICRDAIASQLYNSITDCPQREKLGWLDVPNEMYVSLNANFDLQAFYNKVVLDCFDAQQADGHVPSVAPYYMNVYGDDVNWGGAAILVPYRGWRYYGDKSLMSKYYTQMRRLMTHFQSNTTNYLINNAFSVLSDWGQETAGVAPMVPTEFTETTTYYYLLRAMSEMATELGKTTDATTYAQRARRVKDAFNQRFYNAETATYTSVSGGGGRQSEQAMPLYYGLVPEGDEARVAAVLAERVKADGYKIKTGEIALKAVFMTLAQYGYNDVVWKMANQTDCPSYGYWVRQGYTTTPEYWDVGAFSQNHCMMDHIEEWLFTQLAGIQNDGTAFDRIRIRPYLPADLNRLDVTTRTPRGHVRVAWQRTAEALTYQLSIPAGTTATVILPVPAGRRLWENGSELHDGQDGIATIAYADTTATLSLGSGNYTFTIGEHEVGLRPLSQASPKKTDDSYDLSGRRVVQTYKGHVYLSEGRKAIATQ